MNYDGYKLPQSMPTTLYPEKYLGRETRAPYRLRINGGAQWTEKRTFTLAFSLAT
jgi:hypothetical protein